MTREQLETLMAEIYGDDSAPMYVILSSEQPPGMVSDQTWGFQTPNLDLAAKRWLESQGRWRGRGQGFYVHDIALRLEAEVLGGNEAELVQELFVTRLVSLAVHELGHVAQQPTDTAVAVPIDERLAELEVKLATITAGPPRETTLLPWQTHNAIWIRAALHAAWRAEQRGHYAPLSIAVATGAYELSSPWQYQGALGDEPEQLAGMPLTQVIEREPPAEFIKLWRADIVNWSRWNPGKFKAWLNGSSDTPRIAAAANPTKETDE